MSECKICTLLPKEEEFSKKFLTRQIPEHQILIHEGIPQNQLIFICQGKIQILKKSQQQQIPIAEVGNGSILGEIEYLTHSPPTATATAAQPTKIHEISTKDFQHLLENNHPLAIEILNFIAKILAFRLREMNEKVIELFAQEKEIFSPNQLENLASLKWKLVHEWDL